jgi:hypothetical protein
MGVSDINIKLVISRYVLKKIIVPIPARINKTPPILGLKTEIIKHIRKINVGLR